jgi:hypothetical protein
MLYSFINHMVLQVAFLYFRFVLHRTSRIYECLYGFVVVRGRGSPSALCMNIDFIHTRIHTLINYVLPGNCVQYSSIY